MKILILAALFMLATPLAYGQDYRCFANANRKRGLEQSFSVQISPNALGGKATLHESGQSRDIGSVAEITTLGKDDPLKLEAFISTLETFGERDVSGLALETLKDVSSIRMLGIQSPGLDAQSSKGKDGLLIVQFFAGTNQIGGTAMFAKFGKATACLPR